MRAISLVLGLGAILVGCTSHAAQPTTLAPLPSASSAVVVTPSELPTTPASPQTARSIPASPSASVVPTVVPTGDSSDAAALTAAQAFIWALTRSDVTQDTRFVSNVSTADCTCIQKARDVIEAQQADHQHVVMDALTPMLASLQARTPSTAKVRVDYTEPAYKLLTPTNAVAESSKGGKVTALISMRLVSGSWRIFAFETPTCETVSGAR